MSKTEHPHTAEIATLRCFIETAKLDDVSVKVREFVEKYLPDLVHKLPPRPTKPWSGEPTRAWESLVHAIEALILLG